MVQNRKSTTNQPREKQMRSEYIAKYLIGTKWKTEVRLGRLVSSVLDQATTKSERLILGLRRAMADMVVMYPDRLDIYEFQVIPRWAKFGQLLAYQELAKVTDEFRNWWELPINPILVNAVEDLFQQSLCKKYGIGFQVYTPDWLPFYMETLRYRDYTPIAIEPV